MRHVGQRCAGGRTRRTARRHASIGTGHGHKIVIAARACNARAPDHSHATVQHNAVTRNHQQGAPPKQARACPPRSARNTVQDQQARRILRPRGWHEPARRGTHATTLHGPLRASDLCFDSRMRVRIGDAAERLERLCPEAVEWQKYERLLVQWPTESSVSRARNAPPDTRAGVRALRKLQQSVK